MKFKKKEGHELRWYEIRLGEVCDYEGDCMIELLDAILVY